MTEETLQEILASAEHSVRSFTDAEIALAETEQQVGSARQDVLDQVKRLRNVVEAVQAPELVALLRHVYWQQPGIPGRPLAEAAGLQLHEMLAAIGPAPSGVLCVHCGMELYRTSRSWRVPAHTGGARCPDCAAQERQDSELQWYVERLRARAVAATVVKAPARHWRAATELVLAYPPLSQRASDLGSWCSGMFL